MMTKGVLYGLVVNAVNFLLYYFTMRLVLRPGAGTASALLYGFSALARYAVIGAAVYVFLKYRLGSVTGLIIGFSVGLAAFTAWRVGSGAHPGSGNL